MPPSGSRELQHDPHFEERLLCRVGGPGSERVVELVLDMFVDNDINEISGMGFDQNPDRSSAENPEIPHPASYLGCREPIRGGSRSSESPLLT